jgi:ribonuclease R
MPRKNKPSAKKLSGIELQVAIAELFKANPGKRYAPAQIIDLLGISNNKDSVKHAVSQLEARKELVLPVDKKPAVIGKVRTYGGRNVATYQGVVDLTRTGAAYVHVEGLDQDVYVPAPHTNTAMHRDVVLVRVLSRPGVKPEGVIESVVERHQSKFIGTVRHFHNHALVFPDLKQIPFDIYVSYDLLMGAEDGEKVLVDVIKWSEGQVEMPLGRVTQRLGVMGGHEYEANVVLINSGFDISFAPEVNEEAEKLKPGITAAEIKKRIDLREVVTFTIDPADAKDFDDAISVRRLDNGHYEVGVHIADVAHYVKAGSALDKEAARRTTSVYLVGRVCPMLPERLSNGLCSLRPHEEKLTFSAIFEMDEAGVVYNRLFGRSVIYSDRRFTYEEAQEVIETGTGDFADELQLLNRMATALRTRRFAEGSINFDETEVRFELDEQGEPVGAYSKTRKEAHLLVEDFMLLANREVAAYMALRGGKGKEVPFVYRIHDAPDMERLAELGRSAAALGVRLDLRNPDHIPASLNKLIESARSHPTLAVLAPLAIRCMAKAIYSTKNIGHYGLGFAYYSHFTSPIRRYADVLSHRILAKNFSANPYRADGEELESICSHISKMERKAVEAEREYTKYMQAVYMKRFEGEVLEGTVTGFIERGFFVEVGTSRAEGMIVFDRLRDFFQIADDRLSAVGTRKGRIIKLGQKLKVKVLSSDPVKRQIELSPVEWDEAPVFSESQRKAAGKKPARTAPPTGKRRTFGKPD